MQRISSTHCLESKQRTKSDATFCSHLTNMGVTPERLNEAQQEDLAEFRISEEVVDA